MLSIKKIKKEINYLQIAIEKIAWKKLIKKINNKNA